MVIGKIAGFFFGTGKLVVLGELAVRTEYDIRHLAALAVLLPVFVAPAWLNHPDNFVSVLLCPALSCSVLLCPAAFVLCCGGFSTIL